MCFINYYMIIMVFNERNGEGEYLEFVSITS